MILSAVLLATSPVSAEPTLALADTHIHYSHDAWSGYRPIERWRYCAKRALNLRLSPVRVMKVLRSSMPKLRTLLCRCCRPYRARGELSSWMHDDTVPRMLADLLKKNKYAGIGEFHAFGDDIDLPVLQAAIAL